LIWLHNLFPSEIFMTSVVVAYHSGYGHTQRVAQAVADGAGSVAGTQVKLLDVSKIVDTDWQALDAADAIVFGAPTYMGGPSGPFKVFADATSQRWFTQGWKNKIAGGFTCSLSMSGDKYSTLMYFVTLAMQHAMVWVGNSVPPTQQPGAPETMNRLGSSIGVMAQADNAPADVTPPQGDLDTAKHYGERIATYAAARIK
jgi:NAD(P)H dehydrogenase (quinone)